MCGKCSGMIAYGKSSHWVVPSLIMTGPGSQISIESGIQRSMFHQLTDITDVKIDDFSKLKDLIRHYFVDQRRSTFVYCGWVNIFFRFRKEEV